MANTLSDTNRINFLGLKFNLSAIDETVSIIKDRTVEETFGYVVTPNVDHLVRLHSAPDKYSPLYEDAWLCLCDSKILYLLARFSGLNLAVVPGSDLTERLFSDAINKGDRVCVIGGDDNVVEMLKNAVGANALSHYDPPMGFVHNRQEVEKCVDFVVKHPSRYVFFAVGSPQQEIVARAVKKTGKAVGTGFCIGASIDFLTGKENRAPVWMQKTGLEWLFRLLQNPKRMWKRYLLQGPKIFLIYLTWRLSGSNKKNFANHRDKIDVPPKP